MTADTIARMLATLSDDELRAELARREADRTPQVIWSQSAMAVGLTQAGQWSVGPSFMREKRS